MPPKRIIYLPLPQKDLASFAVEWRDHKIARGVQCEIIEGGAFAKKRLDGLEPADHLYVLIHGTATAPTVASGGKTYDAGKLAKRLEKERLSKRLKDLRLYACHSAQAVRSDQPDLSKKEKKALKERLAKAGPAARALVARQAGLLTPEPYEAKDNQLVPMAGQLCAQLKRLGYAQIAVTGYEGALGQYFIPETSGVGTSMPGDRMRKAVITAGGARPASLNKIVFEGDQYDSTTGRWT